MFNPKENLLDQQLAVSGLEMQWVGAAISFSWCFNCWRYYVHLNAKKQQNKAEQNAKEAQKKAAKEQAKATNITKKSLLLIRLIITVTCI